MKKDSRVDSYISKAEKFAVPILEHIRSIVHKSCPDVVETLKWNFPHFLYKDAILCSMASFKNHCAFGFWKGALIPELEETIDKKGNTAMGQFGQIKSLKDLPNYKTFSGYIKKAMKLNDDGVKLEKVKTTEKKKLVVPAYFKKNLDANKKAKATFDAFSYSCKKEYVEWINEAKTEETRNRRMETALEWMEEGKDRNWKYKKKLVN